MEALTPQDMAQLQEAIAEAYATAEADALPEQAATDTDESEASQ